MIQLENDIQLREIREEDQAELYALMKRIYLPVYEHLWKDDGSWYIEHTYSLKTLQEELAELNAAYFFVHYQAQVSGILRIVRDKAFVDFPDRRALKLHRLYLGSEAQGRGVGQCLMSWVEAQARIHGNEILWLDVMDTQEQALHFYQRSGFQKGSSEKLAFEMIHKHYAGMYKMWKEV